MRMRIFWTGLWLVLAVLGAIPAQAQDEPRKDRYVEVRLVPEKNTISPGETLTVGIEQIITPEWHTYWLNPGDSGEETHVNWTLPEGFKSGDLLFPTPHKQPIGPLVNFGYSGIVTLLSSVTAPDTLPDGPVTLKAEVGLLVCKDICIPEITKHTLVLNSNEPPTNNSIILDEARNHIPAEISWPASYREQDGKLQLSISLPEGAALADNVDFFPYDWGVVLYAAETSVLQDGNKLVIMQDRDTSRPLSEIGPMEAVLSFPDRAVKITAQPDDSAVEIATAAPPVPAPEQKNIGLILALGFAILGGLVLNLMPCVFPVLSMKALSLCRMRGKELAAARLHGIAYMGGVLASFAAVAGLLLILQTAGAQIGWGFQLQNPVFVLLLAYLLFMIGLDLAGYFSLAGTFPSLGGRFLSHHGYTGSFLTGILATIVATPCTAPFMGVAMGYALTQPALISMSIFVALGFGLALPYVLLCFIPPLQKLLPKPGAWMDIFRQFLAFPMFGTVGWLIWVYSHQSQHLGVLIALSGLTTITFSIWLFKTAPGKKIFLLIALLIFAGAIGSSLALTKEQVEISNKATDHTFSQTRLDTLLNGNDAIFVNMTADWCLTCKVNERVAFSNTQVQKLLHDSPNFHYLAGDWTNQNPEITAYLKEFGRSGVPLYVYYGPRNRQSGERPAPVILPQILDAGALLDVFERKD